MRGVSRVWGCQAPEQKKGGCPASWVGARAPARCWGARGREGLGGWAGPTKPGGHVAARRDPGQDPGTARACRGVGVPLVARPAAAADALAQAFAPGARWRPMLQAERALSTTACSQRMAALRGAASGTLLGGARGGLLAYGNKGGPPLRGQG